MTTTLIINGKKIEADNSKTLLEVIRENNIADVPALCHSKHLEPFAACSLCVAEVKGAPNLKRTCATPIVDGMVVETDSKAVHKSRKTNLELLLANHKADCYAPCRLACPAGVDVQGYIALVKQKLYTEAIKLIKETNPLPMICGKVCAKPCENVCRRNFIDSPVDIKNIKRFAALKDLESGSYYVPVPEPDTGKKVAIIGSGPAGLSAAYFLRLKGHKVTILEMLPQAGGMMRYGIPEYRLPKADLQIEIDSILNLGVDIEFNKKLGNDFTLESLKKDGYDAIFIGIGAQLGSNVRTPGGDLKGVIQGVDFLRDVNLGTAEKLSGKVFVVGGGNTAIDAARTALRFGAETVSVIYRRTEAEMPAAKEEIEDAKEENIALNILTNPIEYIGDNGRLSSVKLIQMELGEPDSSGRRRPVVIEGSEYEEKIDYIIEAIGQRVDTSALGNMALTRWNSIDADNTILTTSIDGVFAGGDAVTGPSIIISAVAQGRKAAFAMDQYLKGDQVKAEDLFGFKIAKEDFGKLSEKDFSEYAKTSRNKIQKADIPKRVKSFEEVELGLSEKDTLNEAARCLECGCQDVLSCKLKKYSQQYGAEKTKFILHPVKETLFNKVAPFYPVEKDNPFIIRNFAKCILCGRCVQACREVQVNEAIDFGYRGVKAKIIASGDRALKDSDCVFCGECVQVCPTGALTEKNVVYRGQPWEDKSVKTTCGYCGVGCQLNLHVKANKVVRITGVENEAPNNGSLCVKGRYGFDFIESEERLTTPLIKENGKFKEASWDEALNLVAEKLSAIKGKNGSDSIGVLASARISNEENYIIQKFTRAVLKTNNIDHCARLCHASTVAGLAASFGSGAMTNTIADIEKSDLILVTGSNTTENHPVISSAIKRAAKFGKTKLIVIDPRKIKLTTFADKYLRPAPGTDVAWINGLINVIINEGLEDKNFVEKRTQGFDELKESIKIFTPDYVEKITGIAASEIINAARLYAGAKAASIFYCMGITQHISGTDNVKSLANLAMLCGNIGIEGGGVNPLRGQNNVQGACDMGALPNVFTAYQSVTSDDALRKMEDAWQIKGLSNKPGLTSTEMVQKAHEGEIKSLYIVGENPLVSDPDINHVEASFNNLEFLVVQDIFMTETAKMADVVLPSLCFAEKDGTFSNTERRVQRIRKAINGPGIAKTDWEIICDLATRMGYQMSYSNSYGIFEEIRSVTPSYAGINYERIENTGIHWPCPDKNHPGTPILHRESFTRGKGLFHSIEFIPPDETTDADYPLILTTGRLLYQYHTGAMTRKTEGLNEKAPECFVEISAIDAEQAGVKDGDMATIFSKRGKIRARVNISNIAVAGTVFIPFHFAEAAANRLTNAALDPIAKIPEFKVCAVKIKA